MTKHSNPAKSATDSNMFRDTYSNLIADFGVDAWRLLKKRSCRQKPATAVTGVTDRVAIARENSRVCTIPELTSEVMLEPQAPTLLTVLQYGAASE